MNPSDIYILNIKNVNYCCIINGISKRETIKLLKNIDFTEGKWNIIKKKYQEQSLKLQFTRNSNQK